MRRLKVLDLFCGMGGWSIPFIEDGDFVVGVDIVNVGYPGNLILQDVRTIDGRRFRGFDLIIGSPPCAPFSHARHRSKWIHGKEPNPNEGMNLIEEFWRVVDEAKPTFYAMENIKALTKWYKKPYQWEFYISRGGKRCLWTNIPLPPLIPDFRFRRKIRDIPGWPKMRPLRAKIPYLIARFIADCVKMGIEK